MKMELSTQIRIEASKEKIWKILMDFENYPEWNPFVKSISGNPAVGNLIEVNLDGMKFKPAVITHKKNVEFKWLGHLLFKGLFDGEHRFLIEENKDGSTTFIHSERFNGILVRFLRKKLNTEIKPKFEAMNKELKALAEKK